jgi:glycosyltransferase involved in cell wall biosynthesis
LLSVIIATQESEHALVPTLAALVPGALAGIVREVIIADSGSRDGTAAVADAGGCRFVVSQAPTGTRLRAGAALARAPWLLFLKPGTVPNSTWIEETGRFMQDAELAGDARAAVFRSAGAPGRRRSVIGEALALLAAGLGALPRPDQGLLIAKRHYDDLGGHRPDGADCETDLIRRIGRRRIEMLRSGTVTVAQ